MRRIATLVILILCAIACVFAAPGVAMAEDANDSSGTIDSFMKQLHDTAENAAKKLHEYAVSLFWILAGIEFAWACINLGVKGELSLSSMWATLFREIMLIGIFFFLLNNWDALHKWIIEKGFLVLGGKAAPGMSKLAVGEVLGKGIEIAYKGISMSFEIGIIKGLAAVLPCGIILIAFAMAAAAVAVYLVEWYIMVPAGVMMLGLGGSSWTKSYAESYVRTLVNIGVKLFCLQLILSICIQFMEDYLGQIGQGQKDTFFQFFFSLAGLSIITYMVVQQIPQFASALVSGGSIQSGAGTLGSAASGIRGNAGSIQSGVANVAAGVAGAGLAMKAIGAAASQGAEKSVQNQKSEGKTTISALRSNGAALTHGGLQTAKEVGGVMGSVTGISKGISAALAKRQEKSDPVVANLQSINKQLEGLNAVLAPKNEVKKGGGNDAKGKGDAQAPANEQIQDASAEKTKDVLQDVTEQQNKNHDIPQNIQ